MQFRDTISLIYLMCQEGCFNSNGRLFVFDNVGLKTTYLKWVKQVHISSQIYKSLTVREN